MVHQKWIRTISHRSSQPKERRDVETKTTRDGILAILVVVHVVHVVVVVVVVVLFLSQTFIEGIDKVTQNDASRKVPLTLQ